MIQESIDVQVPVRTAYDQWTQFESFPFFMEGVRSVTQLTDRTLRWEATFGGQPVEWVAEIVEQVPDSLIAWRSLSGVNNSGCVRFVELGPGLTRLSVDLSYAPEGTLQSIAEALGLVARRVRANLARFRDFVEQHGVATGAWRGTIDRGIEPFAPPCDTAFP